MIPPLVYFWVPIWILILSSSGFAKEDPEYDPASNFRPNNVTDLSGLYKWVGSYYNATLEIELTPMVGRTANDSVCPSNRNLTTITRWDSILFITERGTYNSGSNPVNLWLAIVPSNYNISSVNMVYGQELLISTPLRWPLHSSTPAWNNRTVEHDTFDMTATKNSNKSFSLSGSDFDQYETASWPIYNVSMPACNSSVDTGDWRVRLWEGPWWNTEGWDAFSYPEFRANFDGKHANLTLDGSYFANSIVKNGISPAADPGSIMGRIQMRFSGILDAYHSDVLDVNSSTPTWLRTVGFGNNSLNIANDSKGTSLSKPHQWILLPFLFVLAFMLY